jgi:hypothetical protein
MEINDKKDLSEIYSEFGGRNRIILFIKLLNSHYSTSQEIVFEGRN